MNCYASIADLKTALSVTSTTDDVVMRKIIDSASRMIDRYTNRYFYVWSTTKYYDGALRLWTDDLLSIDASGLKTDEDGDATYENTLATTDYILYPLNTYPKTYIEISNDSDYGSFGGGVKKSVSITGKWGYGDGISTTPYTDSGTTLDGTLTVGATAVAVHSITPHSLGQTILVELEQMFVESISTTVMTVIRGVNGTTAATHADNITTYIYQYPSDIWQCCIDLSSAIYQNRNKKGLSSERLGDYSYTLDKSQANAILNDTIAGYRKVRI